MRPPMVRSWADCMYSVAPGTTASLRRSLPITWSALILRSASGFSVMNMRPLLAEVLPPANADNGFDRGIFHHHAHKLLHLFLHGGERNILRRLHRSHDASRVLLREETLGNDDVEIDAQRGRRDRDQQSQRLVAQNQLQSCGYRA